MEFWEQMGKELTDKIEEIKNRLRMEMFLVMMNIVKQ